MFHIFTTTENCVPEIDAYLGGSVMFVTQRTEAEMLETLAMMNAYGGCSAFGIVDETIDPIYPEDCWE